MLHQTLAHGARRRRSVDDEPWAEEADALLRDDIAVVERAFAAPITAVLDRAHAELPAPELAALLLAVRRATDCPGCPVMAGALPADVEQRPRAAEHDA